MPVPKKRTSHSRTHTRRAHNALNRTYAIVCPNCAEPMLPHHACPSCGKYRGKQLIETEEKSE